MSRVVRRRPPQLSSKDPIVPGMLPETTEEPLPPPPAPAPAAPPTPAPPAPRGPRMDLEDLNALAAMDPSALAQAMSAAVGRTRLSLGDRVQGRVSRVTRTDVFVDIGRKSEASLALEELPNASVGQELTAYIIDEDERDLRLSLALKGQAALEHLEEARRSRVPVEGKVQSRNAGGYEVLIGSVRAFCPQSLISRVPGADPDSFLGQTLTFRVLETGDKVVLDRRTLQQEEQAARAEPVWRSLEVGQTHRATVRSVHSFGAFAEFQGVEGLIPRSEISWERGEPTELLTAGQEVEVVVLSLDRDAKKVSLSCRRPEDDPFSLAVQALTPGAIFQGRVTRVERYGAFIEVRPGIQALLHSSHLPAAPAVGDQLEVQVGAIDREKRRIDVHPVGGSPAPAPATPGPAQALEGTVDQVSRQGVSIKLPDGRVGWLPANEAELPAGTLLEQRFRAGRRVTVRVIREDPRRPTLTQKQSTEDGEAAWRSLLHRGAASTSSATQGLGTLADLLKAAAGKQRK